jgi:hypothetical protein
VSYPSGTRQTHAELTIAEVLQGGEPMGDLSRFAVEDLTPEEEDEFFGILEEA